MKKIRHLFWGIFLLLAAALPMNAAPILSDTSIVMEIGDQKQLYINQVTTSVVVEWKNSNDSTIRIDDGLITAINTGTSTVTAIVNNEPLTCEVTVTIVSSLGYVTRGMPNGEEYVWRTKTGKKYHSRNDCGLTDLSKAILITKEEAIALGLEPCSKCYGGN